jgi:hypothetical protein
MGLSRRIILAAWALVALGGARSAHARGHVEVCHYTTEIAAALLHAYPEADRNGDGRLSREEACELQAELRQRAQTLDAPDPSTPLPEPLCCNCPEPEVYSSPDTVSCEGVE